MDYSLCFISATPILSECKKNCKQVSAKGPNSLPKSFATPEIVDGHQFCSEILKIKEKFEYFKKQYGLVHL